MISGKAGIVHVHVGSGATMLAPLFEVIDRTEIPITQFHLTHISSRSEELQQDARVRFMAGRPRRSSLERAPANDAHSVLHENHAQLPGAFWSDVDCARRHHRHDRRLGE